jgi:hypothetical protein
VAAHPRLPRSLLVQVASLFGHARAAAACSGEVPAPPRGRKPRERTLDLRGLDDLLADDQDETTLIVGQWTYAGSGWDTEGDAELANAAAARAREYAQERAASRKQTH